MTNQLSEFNTFKNDTEFKEVKRRIEALVKSGDLRECGLDPSESTRFVEQYKSSCGDTWHLALPDHAFRGYLKLIATKTQTTE
ncbi:hypothetical protein [Gimesia sp.]|uniref:hypothetical protein n=1 Tax=Gimesia sp. TaxID=2024833 RepID=UPI003A95AE85